MRVISLVPSLTETLIACGIEVVGRTRFCIHPADAVKKIAVVGGTKDVDWERCLDLKADLVLMDREENTREMAESCPLPWHATHVTSIASLPANLDALASRLESLVLRELAAQWRELNRKPVLTAPAWDQLPGFIAWIGTPPSTAGIDRIEYMIWRNPWMAVSRQTFIGSMLERVGFDAWLKSYPTPYPELDELEVPAAGTFYLFSSEPFPFHRYRDDLENLGFQGAVVDGEFYSWFGVRSLNLLKAYLESCSR